MPKLAIRRDGHNAAAAAIKDDRFPSAADIARLRRQRIASVAPSTCGIIGLDELHDLFEFGLSSTARLNRRDDWEEIVPDLTEHFFDHRLVDFESTRDPLAGETIELLWSTEDRPDDPDPEFDLLKAMLKGADAYLPSYVQAMSGQISAAPEYCGHAELWVNHRVWLDTDSTAYTIPQQKHRTFQPADMPNALRSLVRQLILIITLLGASG